MANSKRPGTTDRSKYVGPRNVKPVSRQEGQQRIRNLKCFQEVYDRILEGWPLTHIAKFIQDVKKESTDVTHGTLVVELQQFRAKIPPAELTKRRLTDTYIKAVQEVEDGLDELSEFTKLYKLQMERIQLDFAHETRIKKLMPTTGQEIRIAKEILSSYADLKMDLGLSKRHIGSMEVDARVLADVAVRHESNQADVQQVLANPQSRQKVLGLVEKLLTRSTAKTVGDFVDGPSPEVIDVPAEIPSDDDSDGLFPEFDDEPKKEVTS